MEWNGMEWDETKRSGMEWNGMEWNRRKRSGMEWNGIEWNGMNGCDTSNVEVASLHDERNRRQRHSFSPPYDTLRRHLGGDCRGVLVRECAAADPRVRAVVLRAARRSSGLARSDRPCARLVVDEDTVLAHELGADRVGDVEVTLLLRPEPLGDLS